MKDCKNNTGEQQLWWDVNQINATVKSKVSTGHPTNACEHIQNGLAARPADLAAAIHRTDYRYTLSIIYSFDG